MNQSIIRISKVHASHQKKTKQWVSRRLLMHSHDRRSATYRRPRTCVGGSPNSIQSTPLTLLQALAVACRDSDVRNVKALIIGPHDTPYEFGFFEVSLLDISLRLLTS